MSSFIQNSPWNLSIDSTVPEDYFSRESILETVSQILVPGNMQSYIEAINVLSFKIELLTDTDTEMFAFMTDEVDPLLKKKISERDHQLIRLVLFVHYLLGEPKEMVSQEMFKNLLETIQNEFKNFPFTYWLEGELALLFSFQKPETDILEAITKIFFGKVEDTWETRLNLILEHPECTKQPRSFFNLIRYIICKNIDWSGIKIPPLSFLLKDPTFSFEESWFVLSRCQDLAIQRLVVEKLLACEIIDSRRFIFFMTYLLPQLEGNFEQELVELSQRHVSCDADSQAVFDLSDCLVGSSIDSFVDFFTKVDEKIKLKAYQNFMVCWVFQWQQRLQTHDFANDAYIILQETTVLDQIRKLRINDSFAYLDFFKKIDIIKCAYRAEEMLVEKDNPPITLSAYIGRTFCIDESWTDAIIYFTTYAQRDQSLSDEAVSFVVDGLIAQDDESQFTILTSLKNTMRHRFLNEEPSPNFVTAFFEILDYYATLPQVEDSQELSDQIIQEMIVAFRQKKFTFSQGLSIAALVKSKSKPFDKEDSQILLESLDQVLDVNFCENFMRTYQVLSFAQIELEDLNQLQKTANVESVFMLDKANMQKEKLKALAKQLNEIFLERDTILEGFKNSLKIEERFLIPIYTRFVKNIKHILNHSEIDNKIRHLMRKKVHSLMRESKLRSFSRDLLKDLYGTLETFEKKLRALKYS